MTRREFHDRSRVLLALLRDVERGDLDDVICDLLDEAETLIREAAHGQGAQ